MKAKNVILKTIAGIAMAGLIFSGCSKNETPVMNDTGTDQVGAQLSNSSDEMRFDVTTNEIMTVIGQVAMTNPKLTGFMNLQNIVLGTHVPCNATIDGSLKDKGIIVVMFHGPNCEGTLTRSGSITLQLPFNPLTNMVTPWSATGSTLSVTYNNFSVTDLRKGPSESVFTSSSILNGVRKFTNVSGGIIDNSINFKDPLIQSISASENIKFENGESRTWNTDRTNVIMRINGVTRITGTGDALQNGYSNVVMWGTNRGGNSFTSVISAPMVLSSACDYNAISGVKLYYETIGKDAVHTVTNTYGVNEDGKPVMNNQCPYGYRLDWVNKNGQQQMLVVKYK